MRPTADDISELLAFFAPHCRDRSTLSTLQAMANDPTRWRHGHALFSKIRNKTLKADEAGDAHLQHQYSLEEICAKTLFNYSDARFPAPFDEESPDYVGSIAEGFASYLGIDVPDCVSKLSRT